MRPLPRQKIYKIFYLDFLLSLFTFKLKKFNNVDSLEKKITIMTGSKYGLAVNKGRVGAYLAIKAIIKPNKNKIILSPFTIFDIINMVICAGGIPVFADVDKETLTIDYNNIKKNYSEDVAGIMITHNHKLNKDIDKIIAFKNKMQIPLIEDCAISFGTKYNNQYIGTLGDIGFYSFGMFKFVSSLNGGFLITNNKEFYNSFLENSKNFKIPKIKDLLKNFFKALFISFFTSKLIFNHFTSYIIKFGYLKKIEIINNFSKNDPEVKKLSVFPDEYKIKISNYQASSIIKQFNTLEKNQNIRKTNAKLYYNGLKNINEIIIPQYIDNSSDGWINFPIQYKNRDELLNFLFINNRDIAKYFYRNCNELLIFSKYKKNIENIKDVVKELIMLPTYPGYDKKQINQNIETIKKYFELLKEKNNVHTSQKNK